MKRALIVLIIAVALFGCSRNNIRVQTVDKKMELAENYFSRGKYNRAVEYYQDVVFERRSIHTAKAQFYLAESYFKMKRYEEAVVEYKELIRLFPDYSAINTAYFKIGEANWKQALSAHYAQTETIAAIDALNEYLERFPFDDNRNKAIELINQASYRLLEKRFQNGYIYYRLVDYSAALMYFDEIIELGNRNELDKRSRYYSALIYIERKDKDNARKMMISLQEHYSSTAETRKITRRYNRVF